MTCKAWLLLSYYRRCNVAAAVVLWTTVMSSSVDVAIPANTITRHAKPRFMTVARKWRHSTTQKATPFIASSAFIASFLFSWKGRVSFQTLQHDARGARQPLLVQWRQQMVARRHSVYASLRKQWQVVELACTQRPRFDKTPQYSVWPQLTCDFQTEHDAYYATDQLG